jgi:outer membrane lipoprotein-sorting protein
VSLAVVAAFTAVSVSQAQSNLSVAQIIDKNIAARGGIAAWHSVQTLTMEGTMDAGGKTNHELPFVMKLKRSHKSRLEITFKDQTAVQVYDGSQGWKIRPFLNREDVEPFTPAETTEAAATDELDGPLIDYAAKGTKVALVGTEAVEGHPAYKLRLTGSNGTERNVWIDAASFLELKIDGEPRKLDGKARNVAIYYRDYQTDHGLVTPRLLETAVEGVKETHKIKVARLTVNATLSDSLFEKPQLAAATLPGPKQP